MSTFQHLLKWAAPWISGLARLGFASIGLSYVVLGAFALRSALTPADLPKNFRGAFIWLGNSWPGGVLLAALTLGFAGFAVWQLLWGLFDPESEGRGWLGLLRRGGATANSLIYGGLAYLSASVTLGDWSKSGSNAELWAGRFLAFSAGPWLLILGGLITLGLAVNQVYVAWKKLFLAGIERERLGSGGLSLLVALGRAGLTARALIIATVGVFLVLAGFRGNAQEAGGLRQAQATLGSLPLGTWLLGAVALGLTALGAFSMLQAVYRRVPVVLSEGGETAAE